MSGDNIENVIDSIPREMDVASWEDFIAELQKLEKIREAQIKNKPYTIISPLLFRGQNDSDYSLSTTLERYLHTSETYLEDYYRIITSIQPQIETFTKQSWNLPEFHEFAQRARDSDSFLFKKFGIDAYSFMVYLRHHNFPSPLLDWSSSPYIATYFAFRSSIKPESEKVSLYTFWETPDGIKSGWVGDDEIFTFGPYTKGHMRHFNQKSVYTICAKYSDPKGWLFSSHDSVFLRQNNTQDVCIKFNLPWTERDKVLKILDSYNLNAYSLFGSDESLMETMALREITFRKGKI